MYKCLIFEEERLIDRRSLVTKKSCTVDEGYFGTFTNMPGRYVVYGTLFTWQIAIDHKSSKDYSNTD